MTDEFMNRFAAQDPAANAEPNLESLRATVFAHVDDNVVSFPIRRGQWMRGVAAAAAIAVVAAGGFAGGRITNVNTDALQLIGNESAKVAAATGLGGGSSTTMSSMDRASSSYAGWYGNTILKPSASVPNVAGEQMAFQFTDSGLDRLALAKAIASATGLNPADVTDLKNGEYLNKGNSQVSVSTETQAWFWSNNNARSPYMCGQDAPEATKSDGDMKAINDACLKEWAAPSDAEALAAAKKAFAALGLPLLQGADYAVAWKDDRVVNVLASPVFSGFSMPGLGISVQVGAQGVFSMNGIGAHLVEAKTYPVDGARDVANRSQLRKWAAFGPMNVTQNQNFVYNEEAAPSSLTTATKNGRLMLQGQLAEIDVTKATAALQQQWFVGGEILFLPAWNYTATDGSVWQMLAISEDYIDWTTGSFGGAVAYDAVAR